MKDPENPGSAPGPEEGRAADAEQSSAPAPADAASAGTGAADSGSAEAEGAAPSNTAEAEGAQSAEGPGGDEDMSLFEAQMEDSELADALGKIADLEDRLARAHADLYNLNQEYSNYVRRSKEAAPAHRESGQSEVIEALIGVLDDIDAARAHGDLAEGPFAAIAAKLESALESRFGLERYGAAGDDFDPAVHEALLANTNPEVERPRVAQILQPGYRRGEKVLRAAKVMVDNPE
ncbi:MAG: nucleotide exchange factor GrpE [Schaalia hyovaginalis]|uniref:nucleotide exchange factor GrpE n=1 Tax=Schaalia hyovaginalis TaxID=29316 RepID=UPI0023F80714|nr:nucleotide exchange factor GrpE [Schaalia hyovaginalis]MCI7671810.1 nucleotide exchange factor GrpE [Schaalia hyovaginalis]MDY5506310.1 nucleotide exchange factor GrpE [Schaalia hyovaginalis]